MRAVENITPLAKGYAELYAGRLVSKRRRIRQSTKDRPRRAAAAEPTRRTQSSGGAWGGDAAGR